MCVCAGSCGKWEDDDDEPASPMSSASTAAFSDDGPELEGGGKCSMDMEAMHHEATEVLYLDDDQPTVKTYISDPDIITSSTQNASTPAHEQAQATLAPAPSAARKTSANARATASKDSKASGKAVKLELELPPEAAAHVANGAHIVVHHEKGETRIEIIPPDTTQAHIFITAPIDIKTAATGTGKRKADAQNAHTGAASAQKKSAKRKLAVLSDEEMIASLAGCASAASTPAAAPSAPADFGDDASDLSDSQLVAALAADAIECSHADKFGGGGGDDNLANLDTMTDQQLAAALAGCAAEQHEQDGKERHKHVLTYPEMEHWNDADDCLGVGDALAHAAAHDSAHSDSVLEMVFDE